MTQKEIDRIIEKYLQGKATKEEIKHIEQFEQFAENKMKNKAFRSKMEKGEIKDAIFRNVQINVQEKPRFGPWLRIAASIAILVSVGIGYYFNSLNTDAIETSTIAYVIKETTWGQKLDVRLPDGSIVKLNSGSKLKFPEKFMDSIRAITLVGEAYFDVVENKNKPFVITTNEITTTVLGTTFNVEAYSDETDIKVTLETGKVSINSTTENALLVPSEQAIFNKDKNTIKTQKVDVQKYLDWKNGVLRFEGATLGEAVKKLEKWYNVTMEFENENLAECEFTGAFKNEELTTVLKSLIFVKQNMNYDFVSNNKIILKGKCTN